MENPFDDETANFVVLINGERQYSLWPAALAVPGGWELVHETDSRQNCLDYINASWTDMRPASLITTAARE